MERLDGRHRRGTVRERWSKRDEKTKTHLNSLYSNDFDDSFSIA